MGGGMPIGAFVADKNIMLTFTNNPDFGHITTFGGHPVSAAAALANLEVLSKGKLIQEVEAKGKAYEIALQKHPQVIKVRRKGLLMSVEMASVEMNHKAMKALLDNGLVTDPFFFMPQAFRIAPPLTISQKQVKETIALILKSLDEI
jgi:adenosylmethionine-8-amino-7-oxononanoate aminotransferase